MDAMHDTPRIRTERLTLVAGTPEMARAEYENPERFSEVISASVPSSWPPPLNDDQSMKYFMDHIEADPDAAGWLCWYILLYDDKGQSTVIGSGGFKGRPTTEGTVEIGYSLIETYHGRGFATEAVRALVRWAFSHPDVERIIAHTFPELKPSIRVLEKNGFSHVGEGEEEGTIRYMLLRHDFENR